MTRPKHPVRLDRVQETLLMPLWARASQSRSRFGLLKDAKAVAVADALDYDFRKFAGTLPTQIGCVLRTIQFDAWTKDFLARHPAGTVVEIGAGLNSRYERTDNGRARFVDVDLPEAMAVRKKFFAETDRRAQFAGSVLDDGWVDLVAATGGPYFVAIEGVLTYLPEPQVRGLFARITERLPGASVAFDSLSRRGVANQHRMAAMKHFDAPFDWSIDAPREIETWGEDFVCVDAVNLRHVALRNRHRAPFVSRLVAFGMATVKRADVNDYWMTLFRLGPA